MKDKTDLEPLLNMIHEFLDKFKQIQETMGSSMLKPKIQS